MGSYLHLCQYLLTTLLLLTYLLTYLLTPWSRVLLEKLTGLQLVKKFYSVTHDARKHATQKKKS
jgi:hypothetical protein